MPTFTTSIEQIMHAIGKRYAGNKTISMQIWKDGDWKAKIILPSKSFEISGSTAAKLLSALA